MSACDLKLFLANEMEAFRPSGQPADRPLAVWRVQRAYPSDFDRRHVKQDHGPEWDFVPAEERCD